MQKTSAKGFFLYSFDHVCNTAFVCHMTAQEGESIATKTRFKTSGHRFIIVSQINVCKAFISLPIGLLNDSEGLLHCVPAINTTGQANFLPGFHARSFH